jgi:hypothetical protein
MNRFFLTALATIVLVWASPLASGQEAPKKVGSAYVIDFAPLIKAKGVTEFKMSLAAQTVVGETVQQSFGGRGDVTEKNVDIHLSSFRWVSHSRRICRRSTLAF